MKSKSKLMHLCMIVSISGVLNSSDMESVLEVGRDNQALSAKSQERIDTTERQTDKIVNEWKAVLNRLKVLNFTMNKKEFKSKLSLT